MLFSGETEYKARNRGFGVPDPCMRREGRCNSRYTEIFPFPASYFSTTCAPSGPDPANRGQRMQTDFSRLCAHALQNTTGVVVDRGAGRPGLEGRPFSCFGSCRSYIRCFCRRLKRWFCQVLVAPAFMTLPELRTAEDSDSSSDCWLTASFCIMRLQYRIQ